MQNPNPAAAMAALTSAQEYSMQFGVPPPSAAAIASAAAQPQLMVNTMAPPPPLGMQPSNALLEPFSVAPPTEHAFSARKATPVAPPADVAALEHAVDVMGIPNEIRNMSLTDLLSGINPQWNEELRYIAPDVLSSLAAQYPDAPLAPAPAHIPAANPIAEIDSALQDNDTTNGATAAVAAAAANLPFAAPVATPVAAPIVQGAPMMMVNAPTTAAAAVAARSAVMSSQPLALNTPMLVNAPMMSNGPVAPDGFTPVSAPGTTLTMLNSAAMLQPHIHPSHVMAPQIATPHPHIQPANVHMAPVPMMNANYVPRNIINASAPAAAASAFNTVAPSGLAVNMNAQARPVAPGSRNRPQNNVRRGLRREKTLDFNDPSVMNAMAAIKMESTLATVAPAVPTVVPGISSAVGTTAPAPAITPAVPMPMAGMVRAPPVVTQPNAAAAAAAATTTALLPQVGVSGAGLGGGAAAALAQEEEQRKMVRAERNRHSAAASRERKKKYLAELERRVSQLSRRNAQLQVRQIEAVERMVRREKLLEAENNQLKQEIVDMDMVISGLEDKLERIGLGESEFEVERQRKLRRPKTWDGGSKVWQAVAAQADFHEREVTVARAETGEHLRN